MHKPAKFFHPNISTYLDMLICAQNNPPLQHKAASKKQTAAQKRVKNQGGGIPLASAHTRQPSTLVTMYQTGSVCRKTCENLKKLVGNLYWSGQKPAFFLTQLRETSKKVVAGVCGDAGLFHGWIPKMHKKALCSTGMGIVRC